MPVVLNKIDPVIINNVHQQTAEEIVHTYEKTKVSKDKKDNKGGSYSSKKMKEKLNKFNSILDVMGIDLSFVFAEDSITAYDKNGREIRKYTRDAVIELFNKMEDMIGVLIDIKK